MQLPHLHRSNESFFGLVLRLQLARPDRKVGYIRELCLQCNLYKPRPNQFIASLSVFTLTKVRCGSPWHLSPQNLPPELSRMSLLSSSINGDFLRGRYAIES